MVAKAIQKTDDSIIEERLEKIGPYFIRKNDC